MGRILILILFSIGISQVAGILNRKPAHQTQSAERTRQVYAVDSGFQTGGNYRPARAPETLLGTDERDALGMAEYFSNSPFATSSYRPKIPRKCPQCQCSEKDSYICGSNGKIYRSQCAFACAQMCDTSLFKRSMSHCV